MSRVRLAVVFFALFGLAAQAAEPSVYDFHKAFVNQEGEKVTLAQLGRGHPVLITMFYGTCPYACPMLISRMKRLEAKLTPEQRADLRVVLVTFDPRRDSVASLKELGSLHRVDAARWSFLRTDDERVVREMAAILGIKYRFQNDGSINHTSVITLLDPEGAVSARMDGLDLPDETILDAVP